MGSGDPEQKIVFNFDKSNKFLLSPKFNEKHYGFLIISMSSPKKSFVYHTPKNSGFAWHISCFELIKGPKELTMKQKSKKTDGITVRAGNVSSNYQPGFASKDKSIPTHNDASEQFHSLNTLEKRDDLRSSLPKEIQLAIKEWAASLSKLSWKLRRRAITRFSGSFADNFLAIVPELSEEEYDSLLLLGTTCMLEELEHEMPITEEDQAKCYLESIHDHHREMANEFLQRYKGADQQLH